MGQMALDFHLIDETRHWSEKNSWR